MQQRSALDFGFIWSRIRWCSLEALFAATNAALGGARIKKLMARSGRTTGGADERITLPEPADAREVNVAAPLDRYNQSGQRNSEIILPNDLPGPPPVDLDQRRPSASGCMRREIDLIREV